MGQPAPILVTSFDFLMKHMGHEIQCVVCYKQLGGEFTCFVNEPVLCVKLMCETCDDVLWDEDNPNPDDFPQSI